MALPPSQSLSPQTSGSAPQPSPLRPNRAGLSFSRPWWQRTWKISLGLMIVILLIGGWIAYRVIAVVHTQSNVDGSRLGFFEQLAHIVTARGDQLKGEDEDRINVLMMGIGGPGHDGPYLTDTMMVASYRPSTKQVAFLSLPRDLVVNIPGYDYRKINNVLSIGRDQKYPGGGEALVVKVVGDLLDLPIQYYARVDFQGFSQLIDQLSGVTVNVETAFTDAAYPTENYGYQTVRFQAGEQTMNGATALKFARSRHGNNGEGSDFARAARQQKILVAVREKVLSLGTILNPIKVSEILQTLGNHSVTNMEIWEMVRLGTLAKDVDRQQIINVVLDDQPGGLLRPATGTGGAFILVPRASTYADIRFLANNIFTNHQAVTEAAPVAILNSTKQKGAGEAIYNGLESLGLDMKQMQTTTGVTDTVLVDATAGAAPATAALIGRYAHTSRVLSPVAYAEATGDRSIFRLLEPPANQPDAVVPKFILILGSDQPAPAPSIFSNPTRSTNTNTNRSTNKNTNTNKNNNKNTNKNTNAANKNANRNANGNVNSPANTDANSNTNTNS